MATSTELQECIDRGKRIVQKLKKEPAGQSEGRSIYIYIYIYVNTTTARHMKLLASFRGIGISSHSPDSASCNNLHSTPKSQQTILQMTDC